MKLFDPILPEASQHRNFKTTLSLRNAAERDIVSQWVDGMPNRDNKFVEEFQRSFNSSFWEIYLHGLFKEYGFEMDWAHQSPDFWLKTNHGEVLIEAVTANAAMGAVPEWERPGVLDEMIAAKNFWPLNREAIIRLSNAMLSKLRRYNDYYRTLPHVGRKPFVIAIAPFEQPYFNHQYDRAIRALLYDEYVDETAFYKNRAKYPIGPPTVQLGSVEKDNGTTIDLGLFLNDGWPEVSAVIFSCAATWGKASAMSPVERIGWIASSWGDGPDGQPVRRRDRLGAAFETISDGLQVFHNPHARYPLNLGIFRRKGVIQQFVGNDGWVREGQDQSLQFRISQTLVTDRGEEVIPE